MRIVTFAAEKIGDTIMATPLFKALRNFYPTAAIDIVTEIDNHPVLEGIGLFNQIIPFWEGIDLSSYDLAIMPVFSCGEPVHKAARKAKRFVNLRELYPLRPRKFKKRLTSAYAHMLFEKHQVELNMDLLRSLGYRGGIPELYCPAPQEEIYPEYKDKIGCCIYTPQDKFQAGKNRLWPLKHWKELIELLGKEKVLLVGWVMDSPNLEEVSSWTGCTIQVTKNVKEFVGLCKQLKILITTDHGAMHIAATSGVPIISLHGVSSPSLLHPWVGKKGKSISILSPKFCSPCQRSYRLRICDKGLAKQNCMEKITPDLVMKAIDRTNNVEIGESKILVGQKLMSIEEFRHNWKIQFRHLVNICISREIIRIAKMFNPNF